MADIDEAAVRAHAEMMLGAAADRSPLAHLAADVLTLADALAAAHEDVEFWKRDRLVWKESFLAAGPALTALGDALAAARAREAALRDAVGEYIVSLYVGNESTGPEFVAAYEVRDALQAILAVPLRAVLAAPTGTEHVHDWRRQQNVTSKGDRMPAIEVCRAPDCDAARPAPTDPKENDQ